MTRLTCLLPLFVAALLLATPAQAQQRVALLIGNAAYPVGRLTNPPQDIKEMEAALREVGFKVQTVRDAGQAQMKRAVRDFGEMAQGADIALLYYSGHGTQALGENYLIPVDASIRKESDYDVEAVSANAVMRQILIARPRAAIVVLDACRDNPHAAFTRSGTKGLSRMDAPTGSMIAFATAPGTTASDEGLYARALAANIRKKGLELVDVFRDTAAEVRRLSSNRQDPRVSEMSINERVYLAGRDDGSGPAPVAAAPVTRAELSTQVALISPPATEPRAAPATASAVLPDDGDLPSAPLRPIPAALLPYEKAMQAAAACAGETRNPMDMEMRQAGKHSAESIKNQSFEVRSSLMAQSPGLRLVKNEVSGLNAPKMQSQTVFSPTMVQWTAIRNPVGDSGPLAGAVHELNIAAAGIECSGPLMPLSVGKKFQLKYSSTTTTQWQNHPTDRKATRLVADHTTDISVLDGPWSVDEAERRHPLVRLNGPSSARWKVYEVRMATTKNWREVPAEQRQFYKPEARSEKYLFVEGPNLLVPLESEHLQPGWTVSLTETAAR